MKTALHSWSIRNLKKHDESFGPFEFIRLAADMGFGGIELMTGKAGSIEQELGSEETDHVKKVVAEAKSAGCPVDCFSTYNDFAFLPDENWRLANVEYIKRWLEISGDMGVANIRMLTGYYKPDADHKKQEALTRKGIEECVPVAEKAGVNMAIENHNSIWFEADDLMDFIKELGSPRLTTCPDPANWGGKAFWEAPTADIRDHVIESARKCAPLMTQSHLKFRGFNEDGSPVGWGDSLERLIRVYHEAGFNGALAFESVPPVDDLVTPLETFKPMVDDMIARVTGA